LGGGTDIESFYSRYGGLCLSIAINIRQKIILSDEINFECRFPLGGAFEFYQKFLDEFNLPTFKFKSEFNGVITGGLGSSASAAVALIGACLKIKGHKIDRDFVARMAWETEVKKLGLFGGKQDQYAAAFGGVNVFEFRHDGTVHVNSLVPSFVEPLMPYLLLVDTRLRRVNPRIQENMMNLTEERRRSLEVVKANVLQGIELLSQVDIEAFGRFMHANWEDKKRTNLVSNKMIDEIYVKARQSGAWGGKLLGSGGGGYMLLIAHPTKHQAILEATGLDKTDFSVDWNGLDVRKL
jgi:D-glycero-alpha-D-manno-heptose-7-phosphate kinase